ncbi:hypothetical protein JDV02_010278 [Purpureocillium takamizusanense]|uniref:FAD-binding PCMH-type domain-containing protein n=1 Tax=Purpureocillium takamizusanense TaxID=2060973 RepID=A0A9Q8VH91_9HYPO|nr:uncharacterized protein JDV02_010278 [Purpureocillium takamizusanense]UNI24542.1 hypothetical protein JDV02_010278 [Purpureocillium takamizusanense]
MLLPGDTQYEARIESWWSASSRLRPCCIIQPRTKQDVAVTLQALARCGHGGFAVRSGGHSHWAGGSNIVDGVTIDLVYFNAVSYNPILKVASIGPAQTWGNVYKVLESEGVMVAGGRDADVGVGGLLTGGGNSYYADRKGFACDNVVNAEVVLANGTIVEANENANEDLWRALKGGLSNFGIVTSQEAAFIINFTHQPSLSSDIIVAHVLVDTDGVQEARVFDEVQRIPAFFSDLKTRTMSGIANDYILPSGLRNVWFTLTFRNDKRVVKAAAEMHETLVEDLLQSIPADDLVTQSLFQPLPTLFADIGAVKGGNVLGLDMVKDNSLLWLCAASCRTTEQESIIYDRCRIMTANLKRYAESISAIVPWIYVNYADPSQDALSSYGEDNVLFMRQVAQKYDPHGLFQNLLSGSFRLPKC